MNDIEIAELKDRVLKYLSEHDPMRRILRQIYNDLNIDNISLEIASAYLYDMVNDGDLDWGETSGDRHLYWITEQGKRHLFEGGYTAQLKLRLQEKQQKADDYRQYKEKTSLEIGDLRQRSANYERTDKRAKSAIKISVISVIIAGISIIVTIILKIFFN